jgi:hypothetical protein
MKRLKLIFAGIFLLSVTIVNGQVFIGGNLGFSSTGGSNSVGGTSTDNPTTTLFTFSPMGGYFLSDKLAVGGYINFSSKNEKFPGNPESTLVTNTFGLQPFIRYYALRINKFSIFGQGYIGYYWSSEKSTPIDNNVVGPTTTLFMFGIIPGISFDLTNNISLEASINLLNLSYSYYVEKVTSDGTENKTVSSNFSFGAGVDNIETSGTVSIGAIFKL